MSRPVSLALLMFAGCAATGPVYGSNAPVILITVTSASSLALLP